ncbi:condensation domain-containing protein [uncultured Clostridium sp.]|uniref:condensation domain-containing protein n=1 Tax=uncultured Clostridium sp. TaxID=59620 RepID=UPI0025EE41A3|nr:condensation domain-containing protein [uncultured Clostridium sp.]
MYSDIAIIGMSGKFPKGETLEQFHKNLLNKTDCISKISDTRRELCGLDKEKEYQQLGYIENIEYFDNEFFNIAKKEAENMSPEQRLCLELAAQTILDAGYSLKSFRGTNCAVIASCTDNEYEQITGQATGLSFIGSLKSMLSGKIAYYLDLHGPNIIIDTGCSSTLVGIHEACMKLITGECDYSLVGGMAINLIIPESEDKSNDALGIGSKNSRCKSFDDDADGTAVGEGGGFVLLKRLEDAKRDNDNIYAVIKGSAINGDGVRCSSATTPSVEGQKEAMIKAWKAGNVKPEEFTGIEAHGTGTKIGDPIEVESITESIREYTDKKSYVTLGSVKSNIGHLGFTAGIASVIKVLLEFNHNVSYPICNFNTPNRLIKFEETPLVPVKETVCWKDDDKRLVGINSFGLSGTNAHIVLEKYNQKLSSGNLDETNRIVKISARSSEAFEKYALQLRKYIKGRDDINDIVYTMNIGRDDYKYRRILRIKDLEDLYDKLEIVSYARENEKSKIIFLISNEMECESINVTSLKNKYDIFKRNYECYETVSKENSAIDYKAALYMLLNNLGIEADYIFADDFGKAMINMVKEKISYEEVADIACKEKVNSINKEKCIEQLEKLSRDNKILVINFGSSSLDIEDSDRIREFVIRDCKSMDDLIISLYNQGFNIEWNKYYEKSNYKRISIPTYCFDKVKHWLKVEKVHSVKEVVKDISKNEEAEFNKVYDEKENLDEKNVKEELVSIWQDVLGYDDEIDYDESFFDLGGNSLLITMLTDDIEEKFNVSIDVAMIYDYSTINEISKLIIEKGNNGQTKHEEKTDIKEVKEELFDLTQMQKTLFYTQLKEPESGSKWNLCLGLMIDGNLCIERVHEALSKVTERHEQLRTVIVEDNNEFKQKILKNYKFKLNIIDTEGNTEEERTQDAINKAKIQNSEPMKLLNNVFMGVYIYKISDCKNLMLINIHHIISDGWSLGILLDEFSEFYLSPEKNKESVKCQFKEFVFEENRFLSSEDGRTSMKYWKDRLKGANLMIDLPVNDKYDGQDKIDIIPFNFDFELTENLKQMAKNEKTTIFNIVLMAYHIYISKRYDEDDTVIAVASANRVSKQFYNTIGFLVNLVANRLNINKDETISQLLKRAKEDTTEDMKNQQCPLLSQVAGIVDDETTPLNSIVQFIIAYQNFKQSDIELDGMKITPWVSENKNAMGNMVFTVYENEDGISGVVEYNPKLFKNEDMVCFPEKYINILKQVIANPQEKIGDIRIDK